MQRRDLLRAGFGLGPLAAWSQPAPDWPRPGTTIRYVVPFPPGGLTDAMARLVGQQLAARWSVNVVVDNRPGSGGQKGADLVAKSPPDGSTWLAITLTHAANVTLFPKAPFSFQRDLRPVALMAGSPMLVVVPAASPIRSFADLVEAAKSRPLNAGSSGNGTPPHLTLALFNELLKVHVQHVPYKGGAPSITDLIGGQIDVVFSNLPESIAHVKTGKLRALAITSVARHPALPDVPTTAELGMPSLRVENWTGLVVPAGVPHAVIEKIGSEVVKALQAPDVEERARTQGFRVDARSADRFAPFLADEIARWARIIQQANITAD
jgi:tripartite-type tricarboxylate transporter receptor subunit TctC